MKETPLTVYNPDLLTREETIAWFSVRHALLERILDDLRKIGPKERPQHYLIVGQRGMGKTTLLRRLRHAIADDPDLARRWLPITFPEEQYNVSRLSDLWINCLDALSDYLDEEGRQPEAAEIDEAVSRLPDDEESRAREAVALLVRLARERKRGLVLLLDSVDLLFDRLTDADHWVIRKVISENPLALIGASSAFVDEAHQYGSAFYDFFKVEELRGLEEAEARALLRNLAKLRQAPRIDAILDRDPGRVSALRVLTGGNPRNLVLLATVLASEETSTVERDLTALLDFSTPLFKARFESLPNQMQVVVDALALHWHPAPASAIAEVTRLEVAAVSAQLDRLCKQGLVEKVELPERKRTGFLISERLFNIWYLMRASRRMRRRLGWLVEFLRLFYGSEALEDRARVALRKASETDRGERQHFAELSFAYADAVRSPALKAALERCALYLLTDPREEARKRLREVLDLEGEDRHLAPAADRIVGVREIERAVRRAKVSGKTWNAGEFAKLLIGSLALAMPEKKKIAAELESMSAQRRTALIRAMKSERADFGAMGVPVDAVAEAIRRGMMEDLSDVEGAVVAAEQFDAPLVEAALGARLRKALTAKDLVELAKHLTRVNDPGVWKLWLEQAREKEVRDEIIHDAIASANLCATDLVAIALELAPRALLRELILRRAVERDPNDAFAWCALGGAVGFRSVAEGKATVQHALELQPDDSTAWFTLGLIAEFREGDYAAAERAYRASIKNDPQDPIAWAALGELLVRHFDRPDEAERAARKAVELGPTDAHLWRVLASILKMRADQRDEAEAAYRRAIELEPHAAINHFSLAQLLSSLPGRDDEALELMEAAVSRDPNNSAFHHGLAWMLFFRGRELPRAEEYARAALARERHDPDRAHTLACILARRGAWEEAALLAPRFLASTDVPWEGIAVFFAEAARSGRAQEALDLIDAHALGERWLPLRAALEALAKSDDSLLAYAPEVREPAERILQYLRGAKKYDHAHEARASEARDAPRRKRRRARRRI